MDAKNSTRFIIASEQSVGALLLLAQTIARQKFSSILPAQQLDNYITANFSKQVLVTELNSMYNQWLVVYVNDEPAGFACVTPKGEKPKGLTMQRATRIANFGILQEYDIPAIQQSLYNKCWSACKFMDAVWVNEYAESPLITFFESQGFTRMSGTAEMDGLPLPSVILVKQTS